MQALPGFLERLKGLLPWSIPLKLVLSAFLGVLGGAGLLGYLSEYATYSYAIHYGIRPPLEGIPYLRAAVAFGSLFLLLSGAVVFVTIAFSLRTFVWYFDAIPRIACLPLRLFGRNAQEEQERHFGKLLNRIRESPLWLLLVGCSATSAIIVAVILFTPGSPFLHAASPEKAKFLFVLFLYLFAVFVAAVRTSSIWLISVLVVIVYLLVCIYLLFSPVKYSEFLRILGYGGGLTVSVELRGSADPTSTEKVQLMLRTNEAVILYDEPSSRFLEIPNDQIHRIVHDIGGMRRLPYLLPARKNQWGE